MRRKPRPVKGGLKSSLGFTLVEIMLTAVVLALGTLLLHQSYLRLADLYGRYISGVRLEGWVAEQLWDAREAIAYSPSGAEPLASSGAVTLGHKTFRWTREARLLSGRGLYSVRMRVNWEEGNRPAQLVRETYVFQKQLQ